MYHNLMPQHFLEVDTTVRYFASFSLRLLYIAETMHTVRLIVITCLFLAACSSSRPPEISYFEVVGNQAKRVDTVTSMLANFHALPTPIVDAQFVEEKIGDDELGPADYRAFTMLEIAPENLAAWQDILTPLDAPPDYQTPSQPYSWWVAEDDFPVMQFYAPEPLTGRTNGWVALDTPSGKLFIYSFTT